MTTNNTNNSEEQKSSNGKSKTEEKDTKKPQRVQPVSMSDEDFKAKCEMLDEYGKMKPKERAKHFMIDRVTKQLVRK